MMLDSETSRFIELFLSRVKSEHLFEKATKEAEENKEKWRGRWDTPARRIFGPVFRKVFRESLPNENDKACVYVEGEGVPESLARIASQKLFGSAGTYPDMAIVKPQKIAIELDHSERGSGLKMALAKRLSTFSAVTGTIASYYSTTRAESCLLTGRRKQRSAGFMKSNFKRG